MRLLLCALVACGGADESTLFAQSTNPIELRASSAVTSTEVDHIMISIDRVVARFECCGTVELGMPLTEIDLLHTLPEGVVFMSQVFPAARITELNLYIGELGPSWVQTLDGKKHPLRIAASLDGHHVTVPVDARLEPCMTGHLQLVFTKETTVQRSGHDFVLRPKIAAGDPALAQGTCAPSSAP